MNIADNSDKVLLISSEEGKVGLLLSHIVFYNDEVEHEEANKIGEVSSCFSETLYFLRGNRKVELQIENLELVVLQRIEPLYLSLKFFIVLLESYQFVTSVTSSHFVHHSVSCVAC